MSTTLRFGPELRRLRQETGLTLTELSMALNYDKGHLSKVERGERAASPDLARRCDAFLGANGELQRLAIRPETDSDTTDPPAAPSLLLVGRRTSGGPRGGYGFADRPRPETRRSGALCRRSPPSLLPDAIRPAATARPVHRAEAPASPAGDANAHRRRAGRRHPVRHSGPRAPARVAVRGVHRLDGPGGRGQ
ncbi:helix-turn-helix domain-containing protein [Streptomyces angustmyceticus]|nr:helix-turn-helix transcriptional regulator [Streptomyces angustmyceticus]